MSDETPFNFEEFDRKSSPVVTTPLITLQKRGNFGVNRAAYEAMGQPEAVKLLYDKDQQVIGIQPTEDPAARNAYTVRKQPNSDSWLFAGVAFAHKYEIPLGETRRWRAKMHGDILTVDLKQEPVASWRPEVADRNEYGQYVPAE